jgi:hypothetical protein
MATSVGSTVIYVLTASDAALINGRRTTGDLIKHRMGRNPPEWPTGAQAHVGEPVQEGEMLPMLITRETPEGSMVSGQVFLNGSDTFWVPACELVDDDPPKPGQAAGLANADWNALKADLQQQKTPTESGQKRGR